MKQAVIDMGSNSIRLTLYEIEEGRFQILFREKIMAGLADYVEGDALSEEGIARACGALLEFRHTLKSLDISETAVFATASLRNISNTDRALAELRRVTGFEVEVLTGEEEARLGYAGAMEEVRLPDGALVDVGGASTEALTFSGGQAGRAASFSVGSLSLYRTCVKGILPGSGSLKRIRRTLEEEIDRPWPFSGEPRRTLICVGGTARAALKLARRRFHLEPGCRSLTVKQVKALCALLCRGDKQAADLILKTEADRIHTIVPGMMILQHIAAGFGADTLIVSRYGVREGYLCRKLLKEASPIDTPKTGS